MLISLTVGKVDAGVAVLLTEDKRLIEFPSILLPSSISSGSIVDITVSRNVASEAAAQNSFTALQTSIYKKYGLHSPSTPILRCRNATQTSVVLEWDPISLATASIRSLSLYRNGSKAGNIPRPLELTSTKISGLAIDTEYVFHLVLRTSAGVYTSEKLAVRTHKMTDLSGITVTPGVLPPPLRYSLASAVERIGAKMVENVRIDTTHFVCTEGRGHQWERALEMNIPVVRPEWVEGCEREGRIVGVRGYYLNADPKLRQVGPGVGLQGQGGNRRTESQTAIKRVAPAAQSGEGSKQESLPATAGTENSSISPRTGADGQSAKMETEPPTPPAKDKQKAGNGSAAHSPGAPLEPFPAMDATQASGSVSEEEEEDEDRSQHRAAPQARQLVQSPFDSTLPNPQAQGLPLRTGQVRDEENEKSQRQGSDGGSFSEVQL